MGKSKKRYQKNRQKKIERNRRKKRKHKKKQQQGYEKTRKLKNDRSNNSVKVKKPGKYEKVTFPEEFSLLENTDEVLNAFNWYLKILERRRQVEIDLSKVKKMTPEAIAVLTSYVTDRRINQGLNVKGNIPRKLELQNMLIQSGFYNHVESNIPSNRDTGNILVHKKTKRRVETEIAKNACEMAVKHSLQEDDYKCYPIYEILIECMANTKNHASLEKEGEYNWWLFVYKRPKGRITSFTFLDLGVGIFESLPVKNFISDVVNNVKKFLNIEYESNVDLVKPLLEGKINSRTGKKERGQGMPTIHQNSGHDSIKKFILLSNDVFADIKQHNYRKLDQNFNGTLFYWELQK